MILIVNDMGLFFVIDGRKKEYKEILVFYKNVVIFIYIEVISLFIMCWFNFEIVC